MEIFPAIDLKDGKVVRLTQGDYGRVTEYTLSPIGAAADFRKSGARNLHIVDLDGAKDGALSNFETVAAIAAATDLFIEVGGGIRDEARIEKYLGLGAGRVILGTAAVNDFNFLTGMVKKYGPRVAVSVDAKDGLVAVDGWLTVTVLDGLEFCRRLRDTGVQTVIYTDISKDGAMSGTNLDIYLKLKQIDGLDIIASGGVSYLHEVEALRDMGIHGVIIGKALYAGILGLREVLEVAAC